MDSEFFFNELVDIGAVIPQARPDAQTTLASLPAELLLDITEYLKYGEVYILMTVNRLLHAIALQRFYANVHVHPRKIKFAPQIDKDASVEEIMQETDLKNLGIIGGLLARKEHTDTLKFFHLISAPAETEPFLQLMNTLIRAVISRSSRLRELKLPDFGGHTISSPLLDFSGLTFPTNYFILTMHAQDYNPGVEQNGNHARFAQDLFERARPSTLRLLNRCPPESIEYITKTTGSNIESFQGVFVLRDTDEFSIEALTKLIVERMPNLMDLTIGFETSTPKLDQWNQMMTEDIISSIAFLVASLKKLKRLTIKQGCVIGFAREAEVIKKLSSVPSTRLQSVIFVSSGYSYEFWYEGARSQAEWRKWQEFDVHVPIWSPNPRDYTTKQWWESTFKTSEIIKMMIQRMWSDERIPYWLY